MLDQTVTGHDEVGATPARGFRCDADFDYDIAAGDWIVTRESPPFE